MTAGVDV